MSVIITVHNVWSKISGLNNIEVADNLDYITSYYVEGYRYTKAFKQGYWDKKLNRWRHWDGKKHLLTKKMQFPTGLLSRVKEFLDFENIQYTIEDKRPAVTSGKPLPVFGYSPRPYQQEALDAAIKAGRGIIRVGTGGGKTFLSAMMVAHYNVNTMIYVVGKDLLYQFHGEVSKALGRDIGIIGDGICDIRQINICSIWTAAKAFDIKSDVSLDDSDWAPEIKSFDSAKKNDIKKAIERTNLSIFDEAHFIATDTIQSIFKASKKCKYLFGLSGTDWRDDGADLLLESVCGKRIYNMPSSKLIENGYLVQPKITLLEVPEYPEELQKNYAQVYSKYIVANEDRNDMIEQAVRKLIEMGRKPLILVRFIKHGKELSDRLSDLPIYFVNGDVDGETRQEVKEAFMNGELKCLIASSVYDIGVDIPNLDALILGGGGKSTVRALQRIGRVIRKSPNKKDAIVVDFIDNTHYLTKHSWTRIAVYESEPGFKLKFPKDFDQKRIKRPKKVKEKIGKAM